VREILAGAARAPSGGNLQAWRVDALAGERLAALKALLVPRLGELPTGEGSEYQVYPSPLNEPYRTRRFAVGEQLYRSLGVAREDRPARLRQYAANFRFYDAPVGLFVSIDRSMGAPQWSDLGGFLQTVMLLARAYGLDTCAQEAWTHWYRTIPPFLSFPADHILFCGVALGYADTDAPINGWRAPRESVDDFAVFSGFEDDPTPR
jgi:nitroreductase